MAEPVIDEGKVTFARTQELIRDPVQGNFDATHLREVHRRMVQDLPQHRPGEYRPDAPEHVKYRVLENKAGEYFVHYASRSEVDQRLDPLLKSLGGPASFRGLSDEAFADKMASTYAQLDRLHPFTEANSRTLRVFLSQMALEAGRELDWGTATANAQSRNRLYIARDVAVTELNFPGLDQARAMKTNNIVEYEAYAYILDPYRGQPTLKALIAESSRELKPQASRSLAADPYTDSTTGVRYNKLGITDARKLAQAEADFSRLRIEQLRQNPIRGSFDLAHYQAIHKAVLGDVYEWAGTPRAVEMERGGQRLAAAAMVPAAADKMLRELVQEHDLRGMPSDRFIERSAEVLKALAEIHVFRDGNQRAAQVFLEQLADRAGHKLDLSRVPLEQLQERLIVASRTQSADALQPVIRQGLNLERQAQLEL